MTCVFCDIAEGKSHADFVLREDEVFAIRDAHPVAPVHVLIIPRKHVRSIVEAEESGDDEIVPKIVSTAVEAARKLQLAERGFRLVWNCRAEGGQTVDHLHLHLLGGRQMKWPPG